MLEIIEPTSAPTTIKGQSKIATTANGMHIISENGPFRPIRSSTKRCHPLNNIKGHLYSAMSKMTGVSTTEPRIPTMEAPMKSSNLHESIKNVKKLNDECLSHWKENAAFPKYFTT